MFSRKLSYEEVVAHYDGRAIKKNHVRLPLLPNVISQVTPMPIAIHLVQGSLGYEVGVLIIEPSCSDHHCASYLAIIVHPYIRK